MPNTKKIKKKFFHSLKRGTGEAYLLARENPTIDFSKYIIKGALNNYAYDRQCEGERADYILDLITISPKKDKIVKTFLKELKKENFGVGASSQLLNLAKLLSLQGNKKSRKIIYATFDKYVVRGYDVGIDEILEIDGLQGLFYVITKISQNMIESNPYYRSFNWIIRNFQDENPEINVAQELENFSVSNPVIKVYLDKVKKYEEQEREDELKEKPIRDFEYLKKQIADKEVTFLVAFQYPKNLNEEDIKELANSFLEETDKLKIGKYLDFFSKVPFPANIERLLEIASKKSTQKYRLQIRALNALQILETSEIRKFALKKLRKPNAEIYARLLLNNYKQGDEILLKKIAQKATNEHKIEELACSYIRIYEKNKTKECFEPLLELYKKMNCGLHRCSLIEVLIENNVLPANINQEIEFDSIQEQENYIKVYEE